MDIYKCPKSKRAEGVSPNGPKIPISLEYALNAKKIMRVGAA
jgi:hypothetical protein